MIIDRRTGGDNYYDPTVTYYRDFMFGKPSSMPSQIKVEIPIIRHQRTNEQIWEDVKNDVPRILNLLQKAIFDYNNRDSTMYKFSYDEFEISRSFLRSDAVLEFTLIPKKEKK